MYGTAWTESIKTLIKNIFQFLKSPNLSGIGQATGWWWWNICLAILESSSIIKATLNDYCLTRLKLVWCGLKLYATGMILKSYYCFS